MSLKKHTNLFNIVKYYTSQRGPKLHTGKSISEALFQTRQFCYNYLNKLREHYISVLQVQDTI